VNLESSGSATAENGWQPAHLTIWRQNELIGAAPMYIKGHSNGEFVFDHEWANLSYRLGIPYYPKLVGMTPFTPAVGYRFLIAPDADEAEITELMINAIDQFCIEYRLSGSHFLFVDPDWRLELEQKFGYSGWLHHSYIWHNQNFQTFDAYLGQFNANQRRNIKRERKTVAETGLNIRVLEGEDIPGQLFPKIYQFYSSTCDKFYWGSKYLTEQFFRQLYPDYAQRVVLVTAEQAQEILGLSFCIRKNDQLYGRYWGSVQEFDALHFEACYYQPIEWAIEQGIKMFDPGAGGAHKKRRGFPATPNYSLHRYYNPRMSKILRQHIDEINEAQQEEIEAINQNLPFTKPPLNLS
jgi:hypothetical protein